MCEQTDAHGLLCMLYFTYDCIYFNRVRTMMLPYVSIHVVLHECTQGLSDPSKQIQDQAPHCRDHMTNAAFQVSCVPTSIFNIELKSEIPIDRAGDVVPSKSKTSWLSTTGVLPDHHALFTAHSHVRKIS